MKIFIVVVAVLALVVPTLTKIYDRCSLIKEMKSLNVLNDQLALWACIAERESSFDSNAISPDGCYGLFQVNGAYWCQPSNGKHSSNGCKVSCDTLMNDLGTAVRCAQLVLEEQGWSAWTTYAHCKGTLPSIESCK